MKKTLFLTALFTSLLIGFTACSDNEPFEEEWTEGLVGEPVYYTDVFGTLSYDAAESVFYFSAKESKDPEMLKKLGDKTYAIFPPEKVLYDSLKSNIGDVWLKIATTFSNGNSLYVSSIISEDNTRSIDQTPEFDTPPPAWFFEPISRAPFDLNGRYEVINVFVHIVLDKSGSRPGTVDKDYIEERVINTLNYYYLNSAHLCFISMGSDYINYISSSFTLANNYKELFNLNHVSGALNIYIPYKTYSGTFSGVAKDIISNACVIQLDRYDSTTVPHEIGHCFGLYHTHTGTAKLWHFGYYDGENTVPEYVDGSNSTIAGDYIADTDADPNFWSIRGTYSGGPNVVDGHGQQYKPDPQNLMSYNGDYRTKFSPLQIERMHQTLERSSLVGEMAERLISPTAEELGSKYIGGLHFSERTKTLTFPVAAEDEVVTWTISKRSGSSGDSSLASPQVTKKTGKSITIEHTSQADYYEIYASTTTPTGNERKSKVWKATAGVPSPAVGGTLSWSGGNASGSFPGYNPTLVLPNYDTNLDLKYTDLANPISRQGITYRLYTSAGGVQESTWGNFFISEMDISRGYVEVQAVDNCCGGGMVWRIDCVSKWDMFTLDMKDGQLMIGVKPATAQAAAAEKDSAKRNLVIKSIKVTTPEGRVLKGQTLDTPQRTMSLSTAGMAKGQYQIEITDVDGNVHKGHFGV